MARKAKESIVTTERADLQGPIRILLERIGYPDSPHLAEILTLVATLRNWPG